MHLKSPLLSQISNIVHGFGTLEEPVPQIFGEDWDLSRPRWKQVHGTAISCVKSQKQECGEVDALYTYQRSIPVGVVTADCVPIVMAHRSGNAVAAIHSGWRGTQAHIVKVLWDQLKEKGEKPQEWVAAIGPSIGPCCYEVSEELAQVFSKEFKHLGEGVAVPRHRILDLPAIVAGELKEIGFEQVEILRFCTKCSQKPQFHSYRREGGGTRQISTVMITL